MSPFTGECCVCGAPLSDETGWMGHARLGVAWCWSANHPLTDIAGEDVTTHTLYWCAPPRETS